MVFWQFSRNNTYVGIPGKLSEVHLHASLFSNPCGKVLIHVGISWSLDLRVQHIIPLQYTSWSVSCFYVLSAYPCSYNSDHINNTYVFVELETGQGFLNEGNQCFL